MIAFCLVLFYNFIMIKTKSRTKSSLPVFVQQQSNQILEPIYSKVNILKRELEMINNQQKQSQTMQNFFTKTWKQQFLEMNVDRDLQIQKQRKFHESQSSIKKSEKKDKKLEVANTATNWKDHRRNNTKSLINFLVQNKSVKRAASQTGSKFGLTKKQSNEDDLLGKNDKFEPLGEEYKKEKLYQESLRSQSQSLSASRNDESSLHSSSALGIRKESSKKYLRKGTRVRQILMRQLQTPQERGSSASSLTYLKDYDQWVPSALVEEKKAQLETFMNIIYGEKKAAKVQAVDLNAIELIYL